MLKINAGSGHYLIGGDVFSLRVCATKGRELYPLLFLKCEKLEREGKLSGLMWIDDQEHKLGDLTCIIRRWAKEDNTIFIPNKDGNET